MKIYEFLKRMGPVLPALAVVAFVSLTVGIIIGRNSVKVSIAAEGIVSDRVFEVPQVTEDEIIEEQTECKEESDKGKININLADAEELMTLPGIGKTIANRIIEYRKYNGLFRSADEIMNVTGIGTKMYAEIKDKITVGSLGK